PRGLSVGRLASSRLRLTPRLADVKGTASRRPSAGPSDSRLTSAARSVYVGTQDRLAPVCPPVAGTPAAAGPPCRITRPDPGSANRATTTTKPATITAI